MYIKDKWHAYLIVICMATNFYPSLACAQSDVYRSRVEDIGDVIQVVLPASGFIASLVDGDKKSLKEFGFSFAATVVTTHGLKAIIRKKRPGDSMSYDAMPSGHTSAAFHGASFIQRKYGWSYGVPAYVLAGFVGYSRVEGINRRHDVWDVLAGAALGISTSYILVKKRAQNKVDLDIEVLGNDGGALRLVYRW